MAKSFIEILSFLAAIVAFYFTWTLYIHIYSKKELYRKSAFGIFIGRTITALLVAVVCASSLLAAFQENKEPAKQEETIASDSKLNVEKNQDSSTSKDVVPQSKFIETPEKKPSEQPPKNTTSSLENIEETEDKVNYHGNDPIVRERLGLPPKNEE